MGDGVLRDDGEVAVLEDVDDGDARVLRGRASVATSDVSREGRGGRAKCFQWSKGPRVAGARSASKKAQMKS